MKQKQEPLKVMAIGDATTRTGLGAALNLPLRFLTKKKIIKPMLMGVGYNGRQALMPEEFQAYPLLRIEGDLSGKDCLHEILIQYEAKFGESVDIVWTDMDINRFYYLGCPESAHRDKTIKEEALPVLSHKTRKFIHLAYFPLDGFSVGDTLYYKFLPIIRGTDYPIACSYWTAKKIHQETGIKIHVIPHGVDTDIFYPINPLEARKKLGLYEFGLPENAFIVGMIGTNQRRKLFEQFIPAMAEFIKQRPDVYFYMHTRRENSFMDGEHDLNYIIYQYGLQKRMIDTSPSIDCTDEDMRYIYGLSDIQVLLSIGEGFGIPPLYSRAMGIPCLVSDCTALSEICCDELEKIPIKYTYLDDIANLIRHITDEEELVKRLCYFYDNRDKLGALGRKAEQFAIQHYDYKDVIIPKWEKLVLQIGEDIKKNPPRGRFV